MCGITEEQIKYASGEYDVEVVRRLSLSDVGLEKISGLNRCQQLISLDLSSNKIQQIQGLNELVLLERLDLSMNAIIKIGDGLAYLEKLDYLDLHGNNICDVTELQKLPTSISSFHLQKVDNNFANPCCQEGTYSSFVRSLLPKLQNFDGERLVLKAEREKLHHLLDSIKPDQCFLNPLPSQSWLPTCEEEYATLSQSESNHQNKNLKLLLELEQRVQNLDKVLSNSAAAAAVEEQ